MIKSEAKKWKDIHIIDMHHHTIPPFYRSALEKSGVKIAAGLAIPEWSPEIAIKVLNKNKISLAMTSILPGVYFPNSPDIVRKCNEYAAELKNRFPTRFGAFASLPMLDSEKALNELDFVLDELQLDGVALVSNFDGKYLGDQQFEEVIAELNRRKITVFVHPSEPLDPDIPEEFCWAIDSALDTTRAVMSLLYSGYLERYSNVNFILSHVGGIVPYLAKRIALGQLEESNKMKFDLGMFDYLPNFQKVNNGIELLKKLYYDTLAPARNAAYKTVLDLVDHTHLVLATDYVWLPKNFLPLKIAEVKRYFDNESLRAIFQDNPLRLFPHLREVLGV
ncbi:MAG: amidohydrolase [Asgard group archaeon]|nr:amidohydrolase [Asgard group archaeon]